jgi:hypothetical protein
MPKEQASKNRNDQRKGPDGPLLRNPGGRSKEAVPIGMVSMITMAVVPVPPMDGTIEGPTWT